MSNRSTEHQTHYSCRTKEDTRTGHQPVARLKDFPTLIGLMIEHLFLIGIIVAAAMAIGWRFGP